MTRHLSEEELILHFYGTSDDRETTERHLALCPQCRQVYSEQEKFMDLLNQVPVPEKPADYGQRARQRLFAELEAQAKPRARFSHFLWVWAGAATLMLAFVLGRLVERESIHTEPRSRLVSGRVLDDAVARHLESTQRMLVDLANTTHTDPEEQAFHQNWARQLVIDNRFFRLAAMESESRDVIRLLDELELVLLELAHGSHVEFEIEEYPTQEQVSELILRIRIMKRTGKLSDPDQPRLVHI